MTTNTDPTTTETASPTTTPPALTVVEVDPLQLTLTDLQYDVPREDWILASATKFVADKKQADLVEPKMLAAQPRFRTYAQSVWTLKQRELRQELAQEDAKKAKAIEQAQKTALGELLDSIPLTQEEINEQLRQKAEERAPVQQKRPEPKKTAPAVKKPAVATQPRAVSPVQAIYAEFSKAGLMDEIPDFIWDSEAEALAVRSVLCNAAQDTQKAISRATAESYINGLREHFSRIQKMIDLANQVLFRGYGITVADIRTGEKRCPHAVFARVRTSIHANTRWNAILTMPSIEKITAQTTSTVNTVVEDPAMQARIAEAKGMLVYAGVPEVDAEAMAKTVAKKDGSLEEAFRAKAIEVQVAAMREGKVPNDGTIDATAQRYADAIAMDNMELWYAADDAVRKSAE